MCLDVLDFKNSSIVADFMKGKRIIFLVNAFLRLPDSKYDKATDFL